MSKNERGFYSQWGQDEFVVSILKNKRNGYFVDIGAYDGITISNTYYLEKELGWDGLCVEANPYTYQSLISCRETQCVNLAVGPYEKEVDILLNGWSSAIDDDFTSSEILDSNFQSVKVKAITVNDLLERYKVPKNFDYLSIDIEGGELDIISQFDFKTWRFSLITYEHNAHLVDHKDYNKLLERQKQVEEILFSNGYDLHMNFNGDGFFIDKKII
jgi:FkbM family methyltransferase